MGNKQNLETETKEESKVGSFREAMTSKRMTFSGRSMMPLSFDMEDIDLNPFSIISTAIDSSSPISLTLSESEPEMIGIVTLPATPKRSSKAMSAEFVNKISPKNGKHHKTHSKRHTIKPPPQITEEQINESRQQFIDHFQEAFAGIIGASTLISGFSIANLTEVDRSVWENEHLYDAYTTLLSLTSCFSLYSTLILTHCQSTIARANATDALKSYTNNKTHATTKLIRRAEKLIHESVNSFYMSIFTYIAAITVLKLQHFTFTGKVINITMFFYHKY